jgi:flagellar biogenesis protein FliO
MKIYAFITLCFLTLSFSSFAKITVKDLDLKTEGGRGILTITYSGNLVDYPELNVNLNSIDVLIPNSRVKKAINRKVNFVTNNRHTRIKATQRRSNVTKVKTIVPFTVDKVKDKVSLVIKDNKILLTFPKLKAESAYIKTVSKNSSVAKTSPTSIRKAAPEAKELLNEDYLNSLIDQEKSFAASSDTIKKVDKVKTTQSSQAANKATPAIVKTAKKTSLSNGKSSFSFMEYAGKFVAFLGVVLLLFYGVITLMKKGVIKKGKLGFLNKTDQVTVLSQTFIAPKKSLMLIKAHNQVFLVSNTDAGIHPISEINDVSGLIKNGEKIIAGNNFDDSLGDANVDEKLVTKIKIKEDISQSNKQSSLSEFIGTKDRVKFSDQIKKKVKGLKPLQ